MENIKEMPQTIPKDSWQDASEKIVFNFERIEKHWQEIESRNKTLSSQLTLSLIVNVILAILALKWYWTVKQL